MVALFFLFCNETKTLNFYEYFFKSHNILFHFSLIHLKFQLINQFKTHLIRMKIQFTYYPSQQYELSWAIKTNRVKAHKKCCHLFPNATKNNIPLMATKQVTKKYHVVISFSFAVVFVVVFIFRWFIYLFVCLLNRICFLLKTFLEIPNGKSTADKTNLVLLYCTTFSLNLFEC